METKTHLRPDKADYIRSKLIPENISDTSIDNGLRRDCLSLLRPYNGSGPRASIFNLGTILYYDERGNALSHSISAGLIYGAICKEFYAPFGSIGFFQGFMAGLIHDPGKGEEPELFGSSEKFDEGKKDRSKDHVFYTSDVLRDDYPYLKWLVNAHHLYGQPDGLAFPENYVEKNKHMRSLQMALSIADKASASTEIRPELTSDEVANRKNLNGILANIERLRQWYKPEQSLVAPKQIDFVKKTIQQKIVITPDSRGKSIPVDNDLARKLIEIGSLKPDGSRLELDILRPLLPSIDFALLLADLIRPKGASILCGLKYEPVSDIRKALQRQ